MSQGTLTRTRSLPTQDENTAMSAPLNAAAQGSRWEARARSRGQLTGGERRRLDATLLAGRESVLDAWYASQFDLPRLRRFGIRVAELPSRTSLLRAFLQPLFQLLRAWLRTGEGRYRDVYLDERLRYAPHQAAWALRTQFFDEVLPSDEGALLALVKDEPARSALAAALKDLHAPLRAPAPARPIRVMGLGDCLMNELRVALFSRCRAEGLPLDFRVNYFSAIYGSGLSTEGTLAFLREFPADLIAMTFLSYKGIAPFASLMREGSRLPPAEVRGRVDAIVATMRDFMSALREHTDATFVVHDASGLPLTHLRRFLPVLSPLSSAHRDLLEVLNAAVTEVVDHTENAVLLGEAAVARAHGLRTCSQQLIPSWIASGDFHTSRFGELLVPAYLDVIHSHRELSRCKVLAVDFDNTLWDGVMADGAVEQRHGLQRTLRRLEEAGIVLVAVSKNDPKNVRWEEMTLKPDDFVLQKISWDLKVRSLQEAAQELDLGLDSFVLLDDNPAERDLVRSQLPQVRTLDPNAPHAVAWLERMLRFPNTRQTEEARKRTELYRQGLARKAALHPSFDYATMMASLQLDAKFGLAARGELDRVAELVQRTNQFNTTALRYTRKELAALAQSPDHAVYTASLSDKFGSVGLVATAIVRRQGHDRILESFVMSCRAMGYGLEQLVLRRVLDAEDAPQVRFIGRYLPTDRNTPCSKLYESAGFTADGEGAWILEPGAPRPPAPAWFTRAP